MATTVTTPKGHTLVYDEVRLAAIQVGEADPGDPDVPIATLNGDPIDIFVTDDDPNVDSGQTPIMLADDGVIVADGVDAVVETAGFTSASSYTPDESGGDGGKDPYGN